MVKGTKNASWMHTVWFLSIILKSTSLQLPWQHDKTVLNGEKGCHVHFKLRFIMYHFWGVSVGFCSVHRMCLFSLIFIKKTEITFESPFLYLTRKELQQVFYFRSSNCAAQTDKIMFWDRLWKLSFLQCCSEKLLDCLEILKTRMRLKHI